LGEVIAFPKVPRSSEKPPSRAAATVFESRGWRILELPSAGRFVALSGYCRGGVEVGRFDPRAGDADHHDGTEVAVLTRCAGDERLARCAIGWLNAGGPQRAILAAFVVIAGGRYHFWRDAIVEVAAIGGSKFVRLIDGSIALVGAAQPLPLLDPFARLPEHRRRPAFDRLPADVQAAVMRWTDPRSQFAARLAPVLPG